MRNDRRGKAQTAPVQPSVAPMQQGRKDSVSPLKKFMILIATLGCGYLLVLAFSFGKSGGVLQVEPRLFSHNVEATSVLGNANAVIGHGNDVTQETDNRTNNGVETTVEDKSTNFGGILMLIVIIGVLFFIFRLISNRYVGYQYGDKDYG